MHQKTFKNDNVRLVGIFNREKKCLGREADYDTRQWHSTLMDLWCWLVNMIPEWQIIRPQCINRNRDWKMFSILFEITEMQDLCIWRKTEPGTSPCNVYVTGTGLVLSSQIGACYVCGSGFKAHYEQNTSWWDDCG